MSRRFQSSTYRGRHCNEQPLNVVLVLAVSFSPLLIEEGTATAGRGDCSPRPTEVFQSSTYRGRHCNSIEAAPCCNCWNFQSSTYRGRHCNPSTSPRKTTSCAAFSPLLIEEGTATCGLPGQAHLPRLFQSSTYRGRHCNATAPASRVAQSTAFSPLLIEEGTATRHADRGERTANELSVLYLSRKGLQQLLAELQIRGVASLSVLYLSRKALQPTWAAGAVPGAQVFQSSTYRGRHCNRSMLWRIEIRLSLLQSSTYRGRDCNRSWPDGLSLPPSSFQSSTYRGRDCNTCGYPYRPDLLC